MPRAAFRLCACGLLALAALAQPAPSDPAIIVGNLDKQTAPLAVAWLHSPDPRFQAWGAYLILRDRHTEAIPDLLNLLAATPIVDQPVAAADYARHSALVAVLDALIQLNAQVPVDEAQRIYPEFPVQSLILLSRLGDSATPILLDIFKAEQRLPAAWLAAGNLLATRRAEGFAAAVFGTLTVHAQVFVNDPNRLGGVFGGGNLCCMSGFYPPPRRDLPGPVVGVYMFAACGNRVRPEETLLAAGDEPAYYVRIPANTYYEGAGGACCTPDQDLVRQHYLAKLLSAPSERPPLRAHLDHDIQWQGADAYSADLLAFVASQQQLFAKLAQELGHAGLLTESEAATLRPRLELQITDMRSSRDSALPALSPLPENVTIASN